MVEKNCEKSQDGNVKSIDIGKSNTKRTEDILDELGTMKMHYIDIQTNVYAFEFNAVQIFCSILL